MLGLREEEGAEGGGCRHGQRNVGRNILPVHLPGCVDGRHGPTIGVDASQSSGVHQDGEDGKAKCEGQRKLLGPTELDFPD